MLSQQILAVNGVSLLSMPYEESLRLLKNTTNVVELTVSQIFSEYQRKLQQKSLDVREMAETNVGAENLRRRISNANVLNGAASAATAIANSSNNEQNHFFNKTKTKCPENVSLLTYKNEQDFNNDKIFNDNDTSRFAHDDCDNNNHDKDVTVLITNNQLSKNPCNAPKLVNSHSYFTNTNTNTTSTTAATTTTTDTLQSFQKYGFNDNSHSSGALNCSHTEMMSDNCLISANNCIPDLPKVNLQQLS